MLPLTITPSSSAEILIGVSVSISNGVDKTQLNLVMETQPFILTSSDIGRRLVKFQLLLTRSSRQTHLNFSVAKNRIKLIQIGNFVSKLRKMKKFLLDEYD